MNFKSWLKYLVYIIVLFVMIYLREYVGALFTSYFKQKFQINYLLVIVNMLIVVGIGLLLGLEHFISEIRKEGTWKINLPKLILVGLPSLYFSLAYTLMYVKNQFLLDIIVNPIIRIFRYSLGYVTIFQLILGYIVITSFYKYNKEV